MKTTGDEHLKRCVIENISAPLLEETVISRLEFLSQDKDLLAKLVSSSHSEYSKKVEHLRSLLKTKENDRRKLENQLEILLNAISEATDKTTRERLQDKIKNSHSKKQAVIDEIEVLKFELKNKDSKVVNTKAAFEILSVFHKGFSAQSLSEQASILANIIKRIVVYQDKVLLEVFGAAPLVSKLRSII